MTGKLWRVIVDAPILNSLSYADFDLSADQAEAIDAGVKVTVPLGKREVDGLVLGLDEDAQKPDTSVAPDTFKIKSIRSVALEYRKLNPQFLKWLSWLTNYYLYPAGQVIGSIFPKLKKQGRVVNKSRRAPVIPDVQSSQPLQLSDEQKKVVDDVLKTPGFATHLIFGVTGSGKTEIYMHLLQEMLTQGKNGIVIVPEISLTPQLTQRFVSRFGDQVAVLHSQLTDREKTNQWWGIIEGKKRILVGARSALFCPVDNLGLVIVDEEHEPSFKQDEKLKYNARDAAVMRGYYEGCKVVLGSATPSLESWKNALDGKFKLHRLSRRVVSDRLPESVIIDLKAEKEDKDKKPQWMPGWMSLTLYNEIVATLQEKKQVALFLNRRGYANVVLCPECGFVKECPNCDIALTLHGRSHLVCHYCDYREDFNPKCTHCGQGEFKFQGLGTEQIEKDISLLFPAARLARADRDEIDSRESLEKLIADMENGDVDILIGTQMIAKGLDFPNLKMVGIVLADIGLNMPDFRSTERSFQLITQVSGRAGRHTKSHEQAGQVVIQTYNPEHFSIQLGSRSDYEAFAAIELENRKELGYPPFGKLLSFRISGQDLNRVRQTARLLAERSRQLKELKEHYHEVSILGPAEAPMMKVRNQYRFQLLLKGTKSDILSRFAKQVLGNEKWLETGTKIVVDVDPLNML